MATQTPDVKALADAMTAIAQGYLTTGFDDRYIKVENPLFKDDDGSPPFLIIDVDALRAAPEASGAEPVTLLHAALKLTPQEQFSLAASLANNVGYDLVEEPQHPDSPHASPPPADMRGTEGGAVCCRGLAPASECFCETSRIASTKDIFRSALLDIKSAHVPDQPASSEGSEVTWVLRHVAFIRMVASKALDEAEDLPRFATPPVADAGMAAPQDDVRATALASFIEDKIEVDVVIGDDKPIIINSLALAEAIIARGIAPPAASADAVITTDLIEMFMAAGYNDKKAGQRAFANFSPIKFFEAYRAALTAPVAGADASPSAMRERAAVVVDAECARILAAQYSTTDMPSMAESINSNIRMMACILPDVAGAIRALPLSPDAGVGMPSSDTPS